MNIEDSKKIQQYYESLIAIQKIFKEHDHPNIGHHPIDILSDEIYNIRKVFPDIIPEFNPLKFYRHADRDTRYYNVSGIKTYLSSVIPKLKVLCEQERYNPVFETKDFFFIKNEKLKQIIERDYIEVNKAHIQECNKSVIILCGGIIEAILLDFLQTNENSAVHSTEAPNEKNLSKWDLNHLIKVSIDINPELKRLENLSHATRQFRNLIHPGYETRNNLDFGRHEATISLEIVHVLHRVFSNQRT